VSQRSTPELLREDFQNALREMDTYIDVNLEDLLKITKAAQKHAQLRQVEQLLVRDIMTTDVRTVSPEASIRDAAKMLLELRISGLPVVAQEGKLVGIVTEADFLSALGIPCHHPAHSIWQTLESMFSSQPEQSLVPKKVADIMSAQTVTITDDKTVNDVIEAMKRHHVKRLVVANEQNQVTGIITRSDLVKVLLQKIL
jgi:CBS domain-containing membrane protein